MAVLTLGLAITTDGRHFNELPFRSHQFSGPCLAEEAATFRSRAETDVSSVYPRRRRRRHSVASARSECAFFPGRFSNRPAAGWLNFAEREASASDSAPGWIEQEQQLCLAKSQTRKLVGLS